MTDPQVPIKLSKKITAVIEEAVKAKAKAKILETQAKELNEWSKTTLLPIMTAYGIQSYSMQGIGRVNLRVSNGSSISGPKLREALIIEGISSTKIDSIISRASNTWTTDYIEFREE